MLSKPYHAILKKTSKVIADKEDLKWNAKPGWLSQRLLHISWPGSDKSASPEAAHRRQQ